VSEATTEERRLFREAYDYEMDGESLDDLGEERRARVLRDQQWARKAEFVPIAAGPYTIAEALAPSLIDPSGLVDERVERALLDTIAEHLWVRSRDTPDEYIALVEADPKLEWNEPDPDASDRVELRRRNAQVGVFYTYYLDDTLDPALSSRNEILPRVWAALRRYDHLIDAVGVGEDGARLLITRALAPAELHAYFDGKHAPENPMYWYSDGARFGMELARPVRDSTTVLNNEPSVIIAQTLIIVRLRDGRLGDLVCLWRFDPDTERWALDDMNVSSGKTVFLVW